METLREAYELAEENDGAPGVDGVTFAAIEAQGVDAFLEEIRDELVQRTYKPLPARRQEIPKDGGKVRVLSIPAIRDRVVHKSAYRSRDRLSRIISTSLVVIRATPSSMPPRSSCTSNPNFSNSGTTVFS